jgi:hypothetical protein
MDVEEDDVGSHPLGLDHGRGTVRRLGHDHEPIAFEKRARHRPETVMVIHDQHPRGRRHGRILALDGRDVIRACPDGPHWPRGLSSDRAEAFLRQSPPQRAVAAS